MLPGVPAVPAERCTMSRSMALLFALVTWALLMMSAWSSEEEHPNRMPRRGSKLAWGLLALLGAATALSALVDRL